MPQPRRIAVVVGSTRPTRICPVVASWAQAGLQAASPLQYELLDLADLDLPLLDEPLKAALQDYRHEHTRGGSKGAQQLITVLHGLHMAVLEHHVEAVITDDDVDTGWQLEDPDATLRPTLPRLRAVDEEFQEILIDRQG